jgi:hypothetical protein
MEDETIEHIEHEQEETEDHLKEVAEAQAETHEKEHELENERHNREHEDMRREYGEKPDRFELDEIRSNLQRHEEALAALLTVEVKHEEELGEHADVIDEHADVLEDVLEEAEHPIETPEHAEELAEKSEAAGGEEALRTEGVLTIVPSEKDESHEVRHVARHRWGR